jgi:hypothetical protein
MLPDKSMRKRNAIQALGGTVTAVATEIGVSCEAVRQWPDPLPQRVADRVLAALARKHLPSELLEPLYGAAEVSGAS